MKDLYVISLRGEQGGKIVYNSATGIAGAGTESPFVGIRKKILEVFLSRPGIEHCIVELQRRFRDPAKKALSNPTSYRGYISRINKDFRILGLGANLIERHATVGYEGPGAPANNRYVYYYINCDAIAVDKAIGLSGQSDEASPRRGHQVGPAHLFFMTKGHFGLFLREVARVKARTIYPLITPELEMELREYVHPVASEELIQICGRLNAQSFKRQRWFGTASPDLDPRKRLELNQKEKTERNRLHLHQNRNTLMLLKAFPVRGFVPANRYIGFSHVIPLNHDGHDRYCSGEISDNLLYEDSICALGEPARSILLFSVAVDPFEAVREAYLGMPQQIKRSADLGYELGKWLLRMLLYHVQVVMKDHDSGQQIQLLAQNDGPLIEVLQMAGFVKKPNRSGDGLNIWEAIARRDQPAKGT